MVFSSIEFLCFFLPVTAGLYALMPGWLKNPLLLAASLLFYAWGEPEYILIMIFAAGYDYAAGRLMELYDQNERIRKVILVLSLTVHLGLLLFFKYTDFMITGINTVLGTDFGLLRLTLPIGISFYTFQMLSYVIDVYRRNVKPQHNFTDFAMYICLFPQLIAGPIVRYTDIERDLKGRKVSTDLLMHGLMRFSTGLGKKVLLANQIGALWDEIASKGPQPAATVWIGVLAYTFRIYFDFSGYSDMAIGLGEIFGFHFPENFRYPYEADSITDFWRRWHITLGSWFREYLYIPLGGNRKGLPRQVLNLLIVWSLTGLWHGAAVNFVLWGLFYFVLLTAEKLFLLKKMEKWPEFLRHLYTMLAVISGWALFACSDVKDIAVYIKSLFGGFGLYDSMSLYYPVTYGLLFVILIAGSTHLPAAAGRRLAGKGSFYLQLLLSIVLMGLSFIFLVGDSYNPFLYFRF